MRFFIRHIYFHFTPLLTPAHIKCRALVLWTNCYMNKIGLKANVCVNHLQEQTIHTSGRQTKSSQRQTKLLIFVHYLNESIAVIINQHF